MAKFQVTAGNNETDLRVVGEAETLLGAKRIGRKAVREMLPNGQGNWHCSNGQGRIGEEKSIRTGNVWMPLSI